MKKPGLVSIIIPVLNEKATISEIIKKVKSIQIRDAKKEIIVVDGNSTDGTLEILRNTDGVLLIENHNDRGKGSAVRTGLKSAKGNVVIIQDADLEYDPLDIEKCVRPILEGKANAVYGSRNLDPKNREHSTFLFYLGGIMITKFTNLLYGSSLTDEATCYKAFSSDLINSIKIERDGFDWEPEITAKTLRRTNIIEVPIRYSPRKKGKKISYIDGFKAIWTLIQCRIAS